MAILFEYITGHSNTSLCQMTVHMSVFVREFAYNKIQIQLLDYEKVTHIHKTMPSGGVVWRDNRVKTTRFSDKADVI